MAALIVIDPGHGGFDTGTVYEGRQEKDDNLQLALLVGELLSDKGYEVYYTRTGDTYDSPIEKARIANDAGADLLLSIHRNNAITPNTYSGAEAFIQNPGGLKNDVASAVLKELAGAGFMDLGVSPMAQDAILKRSQMPAVILEVGFINTDVDNQLFDEKINEIAAAIANGVDEVLDTRAEKSPYTYRVQVGGFSNEMQAQKLVFELMKDGYQPWIQLKDNLYRVQVGEIYVLDQAVMLEQLLRILGYNTFIVTEENL